MIILFLADLFLNDCVSLKVQLRPTNGIASLNFDPLITVTLESITELQNSCSVSGVDNIISFAIDFSCSDSE